MRQNMNGRGHYRGRSGGVRRNGASSFGLSPNTALDSNGPCGRIRGNASQLMERYILSSKDARSIDDNVLAETCLQYAEHYFRMNAQLMEAEGLKHNNASASDAHDVRDVQNADNGNMGNTAPRFEDDDMMSSGMAGSRFNDRPEGADEGSDVLNNVVNMDLSFPDLSATAERSEHRHYRRRTSGEGNPLAFKKAVSNS